METTRCAAVRCFCIWVVLAWGVGLPSVVADSKSGSGPFGFAFQVDVPELQFQVQPDGSSKVEIEGFGAMERRPGAPSLPSRVFLIAIPPGVTPGLEYSVRGSLRTSALRPSPVPRFVIDESKVAPDDLRRADVRKATLEVLDPDPRGYAQDADSPWVRLGEPGVLRAQRFVPVHVRGARWNDRIGRLEIARGFDIRLTFDDSPSAAPGPVEPLFESVYREQIVNYTQGRTFRIPADSPPIATTSDSIRAGSTPRQKILVRENGPLRLDYPLLDAAGFTAHAIDTWRLENHGEAIPLQTNDDGDGILEPGEWIQFNGQALDTEPLPVLNTDFAGTDTDLFEERDFSDENVYFLFIDTSGQAAMPTDPSAPQFALTPPTAVDATVHAEVDDGFRPLGGADAWYWLPTVASPTGTPSRIETIALPQLHDPTLGLQVRVNVRGVSGSVAVDPDHHTQVTLLNQADQVLGVDDGMFDERILFLHDFGWTYAGTPASDPLKVELRVVTVPGTRNDVILDYIEVDYVRSFLADNDRFEFSWPDADAEFLIDGFTTSALEIWELTETSPAGVVHPVRVTAAQVAASGPGTFSARFLMDNDTLLADGTPRRFLVFASDGVALLGSGDFLADTVSDLRNQANQADLVVIGHADVLDATPGSALDQLLAHRAGAAGGGLTSKVVRLEDVEDEFNFGLVGPQGIREFLRWVLSTQPGEGWTAPKPTYVLLLGDGSFDYKGGQPQGNYVPTQILYKDVVELGYYASDNVLAAVVGSDQLADLVVGRMPARTLSEAQGYLEKVLDYETLAPPGGWRKHAMTIADEGKPGNNPGEAFQFETTNDTAIAALGTQPYTSRQLEYWSDFTDPAIFPPLAFPAEDMRDAIKDAVNGLDGFDGASLVQYSGHGNFVVWSDDAFFDERNSVRPFDTLDLINGLKLPFVIVHNCLTGGFHSTLFATMGEDWLRAGGGGAIAVLAPSGLSFNYIGLAATGSIWGSMFGPEKRRDIGAPVLAALTGMCASNTIEPCQNYVLLGDPATRLQVHSVEPATGVAATASNLQIDLDWTASATPGSTYRVLRAQTLDPPFYIQRASALAGTTFSDTSVINGTTYYYTVIATDPEGFESAWSNFNSDCMTSGPDCVEATPVNPNPPSLPTGLTPFDPGIGERLTFSWNPNPEADIDYYTIAWGEGSGNPANLVQTSAASVNLLGLTAGQTYCATVSATNTSGKTSSASTEECDFPAAAPGLRLPDFIDDLRVSIQGGDIVLDWTAVTTDVYGKPAAVANYEIYRGSSPDFTNAGLIKIDDCSAPCTSWADTGAAGNGIDQHYRVRAVDAGGRVGGLGAEVPLGVLLNVARGTAPGDLLLSWTAATSTLDGLPVDLGHYALYASDTPFSKDAVHAGALTPMLTLGTTSVEVTPPPQSRFYSVFVVDTRGNMSPD